MFGEKMMILKFLHCQCLGVNLQHQKVMKKCQQVIIKRQKVIKNARIAHQIIGMQLIQEGHFPNHHLLLKNENFDQVCILIIRLIISTLHFKIVIIFCKLRKVFISIPDFFTDLLDAN